MPGFGTIIGQTGHFLITVSTDTPDTRAAAQAILGTCEADLATLSDWFSVNWNDAPHGIWVSVGVDENSAPRASNIWWGADQSPLIAIYGIGLANANGMTNIRDELARMLFVAELAEVLMRFAPRGWDPGNSVGEGLSRVAAAELHPLGYYRPPGSANNGPYSTAWLQLPYRTRDLQNEVAPGPRYDFISLSEDTDKNVLSYGCAILFFYYLHTQLNFPWRSIVSAWGAHLSITFEQLTGRPGREAFTEFSDVLNLHLPPGTGLTPWTENVFPLRAKPSVLLYTSSLTVHRREQPEQLLIELKAGPLCEANVYTYRVVDVATKTTATARAPGTFMPRFSWSIAGVRLTDLGKGQIITIPVTVTGTVPGFDQPPPQRGVPMRLFCLITDFIDRSQLEITNLDFPGNTAPVEISTVMAESASTTIPGLFNSSASNSFTTRGYDLGMSWITDVDRCNPRLTDRVKASQEVLNDEIFNLKNVPHPHPPERLEAVVRAAQAYGEDVREMVAATAVSMETLREVLAPPSAASRANQSVTVVIGEGQAFRTGPPPLGEHAFGPHSGTGEHPSPSVARSVNSA